MSLFSGPPDAIMADHRLAVMSFQIWWVIGIVIGAGVGECLFGRFGSGMQFDHHHA